MRIHAAAKRCARVMDLLDQIAPSGCDAADQIGMSAKIFCPRMQDQIDAPFRWTAIDRRSKGGIDGRDQAVLAGQRGYLFEIDDSYRWIRWRLDMNDSSVRPDRALVLLDIIGIDKCRFNSKFRQPLRQELSHAAINVALRHDVVASLDQRKKRSGDRGHA